MRKPAIAGRLTPEPVNTWHPSRPSAMPMVRAATADDTPEILNLISTSYQRQNGPSSLGYWLWKHEQNPFGVSPCLVATSDGRIVGVRVFLRWVWCSGDRTVRAVRAVDTATLPEWRGRGIFSRLTMRLVEQMQDEGVRFIYNTPNGKSMPGYLKMGWAPVTKIPLWVRPVRLSMARASSVQQRLGATPNSRSVQYHRGGSGRPTAAGISARRGYQRRTLPYAPDAELSSLAVRTDSRDIVLGPAPLRGRCGSTRHRSRQSSRPSWRSDGQRAARHPFHARRPDRPRSRRRSRAQYGRRLRCGMRGKRHG